jgi:hypothetical protein
MVRQLLYKKNEPRALSAVSIPVPLHKTYLFFLFLFVTSAAGFFTAVLVAATVGCGSFFLVLTPLLDCDLVVVTLFVVTIVMMVLVC